MTTPFCSACNDSHRMPFHTPSGDETEVMCTRCPVPCEKCRGRPQGAYCMTTPCPCRCHRQKKCTCLAAPGFHAIGCPMGPERTSDQRPAVDAVLHPDGRCECAGEGTCEWHRTHCNECGVRVPKMHIEFPTCAEHAAPFDWSKLSPRQAFEALRAAPKIAGPWLQAGSFWCRKTPDIKWLPLVGRIVCWRNSWDGKFGALIAGEFERSEASKSFSTCQEVDARLRELGWLFIDDPEAT